MMAMCGIELDHLLATFYNIVLRIAQATVATRTHAVLRLGIGLTEKVSVRCRRLSVTKRACLHVEQVHYEENNNNINNIKLWAHIYHRSARRIPMRWEIPFGQE